MRFLQIPLIAVVLLFVSCFSVAEKQAEVVEEPVEDLAELEPEEELQLLPLEVIIEKELQYKKYTLKDTYAYRKGHRVFQWEKIETVLRKLDSIQQNPVSWGVLNNRRNKNGQADLVHQWKMNAYNNIADMYGVEKMNSIPLFIPGDSVPERYGRDGALVKLYLTNPDSVLIENFNYEGKWVVPRKYVHAVSDTVLFSKAVFVDRKNQNITTLEKVDSVWKVLSMNPATTGVHSPPFKHETPLGIFVVQEKKPKMYYYDDGTYDIGGFSPYATRFSNGAYIHGVPVNTPAKDNIEYSYSLGTTPRSHMCVRNATSHAEFIYDWAPIHGSLICIIE